MVISQTQIRMVVGLGIVTLSCFSSCILLGGLFSTYLETDSV